LYLIRYRFPLSNNIDWDGGITIHNELRRIIKYAALVVRDHLCGLVVRVPGCRSRGPGSIPCATRFFEK
jgi:hypothetical protein